MITAWKSLCAYFLLLYIGFFSILPFIAGNQRGDAFVSAYDQEEREESDDDDTDTAESVPLSSSETETETESSQDITDNESILIEETSLNQENIYPDVSEPVLKEEAVILPRTEGLGNWTNYNGLIFGNAAFYDTTSGGGLAVGGSLTVNENLDIGSTYTAQYNPEVHIGEYKNEERLPALLYGGSQIAISSAVNQLHVIGGAITMSPEMHEYNAGLNPGFEPGTDSGYESVSQQELQQWFLHQHKVVTATSDYLGYGNDVSITLNDLGSGDYLDHGPEYFKNQFFKVNGEVYDSALLITVRTDSTVNFGQWWPVQSIITVDVNWAIDYDLVVFNFPDVVNVTMDSNTFQIKNMFHWSTTVDAWVGEQGMLERLSLSEKVVYNFPKAQSIEVSQSLIQGTILAPRASFTGIGYGDAGHIYGHIIANNYVSQGNFTIHAFHLTHWAYDLVDDALQGSTPTGSITFRQYLYFQEHPTSIRIGSSQYVVRNSDGHYYRGDGTFSDDLQEAAIYTSTPTAETNIKGLPYGGYTLECIHADEGFLINRIDPGNAYTFYQIPMTLDEEAPDATAIHYGEAAERAVYFKKIDSLTGAGIEGAGFTIARERDEYENNMVGNSYLSDEDGLFASYKLPVGTYHLMEVAVPDGYQTIDGGKFIFQVYWDEGDAALKVRDLEGNPLEGSAQSPILIGNTPGTFQNTLLLVKYASTDIPIAMAYTLSDVAFSLYRYDTAGAFWQRINQTLSGEDFDIFTNSFGYYRIEGFAAGRYRLVEDASIPGYQIANTYFDENHQDVFPNGYSYEFDFYEKPDIHVAAIPNEAYSTDVTIQLNGDYLEGQIPLPGSAFRLEQRLQDGVSWEEILYSAATGTDGLLILPSLGVGTYRLTQLSASMGYQPLKDGSLLFFLTFEEDGTPILSATYNDENVSADTQPVSIAAGGEIRFLIWNLSYSIRYSVYKANADANLAESPADQHAYYLEGAQFRLMRRASSRSRWEDYGDVFTSRYQYDEAGNPLLDYNGNHIAEAIFDGTLVYGEYILAEIQPPAGYTSGSNLVVHFEDGTTGRQVNLFYVTEVMAEIGAPFEYVAANYSLDNTLNFYFRKVDMQQPALYLPGSEFILYSCSLDHTHDEGIFSGSCWIVNTPVMASGDSFGLVTFDELLKGDYLLSEARAPTGYRLPSGYWLISVLLEDEDYQITAVGERNVPAFLQTADDPDTDLLLPNLKNYELPHTGSMGRAKSFLGGSVLIFLAILLFTTKYLQEGKKSL